MIEKIKNWWRGKYIPPKENDPNSRIIFISLGYYERPLPTKIYEWFKTKMPQEKGWFVKLFIGSILALIAALVVKII